MKELLEKRALAAKAITELRDKIKAEKRDFTAEEKTQWDKANADYDALSRQIDAIKRGEDIDRQQAEIQKRNEELGNELRGSLGTAPQNAGPNQDEVRLALQGWGISSRKALTDAHKKACERVGLNPFQREIDIRLTDVARTLRELRERRDGLITGTANVGGALVPEGFVNNLERAMLAYGPMLQVAEILRTESGNDLPWPTANDTTSEGELVDEIGANTVDTATPFSSKTYKAYKLGSKIIKISAELLEDSAFNMEQVLASMIGERLGRGQNTYCTTGAGTTEPEGVVTGAAGAADANIVETATAGTLVADDIIDLLYAVDQAYRANGAFMMHDSVIKAVRKLKDEQDQYLWQPSLVLGEPERLFGYPLYSNNKMASTVEAGAKVALFGDFRKYKIRQVRNVRLKRLDELYAGTDQVGFVGFLRFDGGLLDAGTHPVRVLKVSAGS